MRNDLGNHATPQGGPIDPIKMARRDLKKALPRRFWADAATVARDGGFGVDLDGKALRTPAKAALNVPCQQLADEIAAEWRAQGETIDPDAMPVTRIVNSALDGVARSMDATILEVAKFAETDLVCYRADEPEKLVAAQTAAWDPVLAFARDQIGARFISTKGVIYVEQPQPSRDAVRKAIAELSCGQGGELRLAALSVMTSLTGSVLLALAVARRAMQPDAAWTVAHVDDDHQASIWGQDSEASVRRARRAREMAAAALVFELAG